MQTFFDTGTTRTHETRIAALQRLQEVIQTQETAILAALASDLSKSSLETYMSELGPVYAAIKESIRHLKKTRPHKRVRTPMSLFGAKSYVYHEPYGKVLIIGPWNYPFQLVFVPLIGAIAAGNVAIVKPSELATATERIVVEIIQAAFAPMYVDVVCGGVAETQALLAERFDFICFTGSTAVGKHVAAAAAKHLTPVLLELGGKSPVIVSETANLALAAKRIAYGKVLNAGQTCIAPDYVIVHESVKEVFLQHLAAECKHQWAAIQANGAPTILNDTHWHRLQQYVTEGTIYHQGANNPQTRELAPVIMTDVPATANVMQNEIFGPILPIQTYQDFDACISALQNEAAPLAAYLFSESVNEQATFTQKLRFGNGAINDVLMQIVNPNLPFGGMGESGKGVYHGQYSFATFSHPKAVLKQTTRFDLPIRYQRNQWTERFMRHIFRP